MKKIVSVLLVLLIMSSVFAGGGGEDKIEINFLETLSSPARTELLKELIAEYEAANPDVKINLISPPYEQAEGKLAQMLNAKQPLDIIESRDATIKQFVNNGNVMSLESYLNDWEYKDSLLPLAVESARTVEDTAYLLPYLFFAKGMYVRTDILDEHGVEVPTTIDEFVDASITLTESADNLFGFAMRGKHNSWKVSEDYLILSDLDDIDPLNFYKTLDGEFTLGTDIAKAGLARYKELYDEGTPVDGINWGFAEQINGFSSGVTPFLIQDPDAIAMIEEQIDPSQYSVYPLPVGESGKAYQDSAFQGLSIVSYSEYPQEAWDFISFLVAPEQNARFCKLYGAIPVHQEVFDTDPHFNAPKFSAWKTMFSESDTWVFEKYPIESEKFAAWGPFREQTMQRYLSGETDLESTVAQWEEYWGY